ncbi:hypothetical protein D9M69_682110 [compost metagenome]
MHPMKRYDVVVRDETGIAFDNWEVAFALRAVHHMPYSCHWQAMHQEILDSFQNRSAVGRAIALADDALHHQVPSP